MWSIVIIVRIKLSENIKSKKFLKEIRNEMIKVKSANSHKNSANKSKIVKLAKRLTMSSPFQVCQGTCLCAPSTEGYGKGKVLYCYGEVGDGVFLCWSLSTVIYLCLSLKDYMQGSL